MTGIPGSIAVPGAIVTVNNDLSPVIQARLVSQLHINETLTGEEFDARMIADPNYVTNVRALRQRVLIIRDFRDSTNINKSDVVIFVKAGMVTVEKNCFGPPGPTYLLKDIYWGHLFIYNTDISRTCATGLCSDWSACSGCSPCNTNDGGSCGTCTPCHPNPPNEYLCPRDAKKPNMNPFGNTDPDNSGCLGEFTYRKSEHGYMPRGEWLTKLAPLPPQPDGYQPPIANQPPSFEPSIDFILVKQ